MSTWKYCTPKTESGWQIEHFRTRRADGSIAAPPRPAPPSQLATDQQFCSSVSSPIRAQPFCHFSFSGQLLSLSAGWKLRKLPDGAHWVTFGQLCLQILFSVIWEMDLDAFIEDFGTDITLKVSL